MNENTSSVASSTTTEAVKGVPSETIVKTISTTQTPGWKTSEFLISVLGALIGLVLCFHSKESMNEYGVLLIGSTCGVYAISRGLAKMRPPTS